MKTIGKIDFIDLPEFGMVNVPAKIDTGANRSSIHCSDIKHESIDGIESIFFEIPMINGETNTFHSNDFFKKKIRSSSGHVENRYIIKTDVILFGKTIKTSFSLTDRTEMKFPILLGRKLLASRFVVDVSKENLSFNLKTNTL